jgi:peptidoglycan/LPS O-acetylase OafA/YrhL
MTVTLLRAPPPPPALPAGAAAPPADPARNGTLDHARLVAALGIVLFHSGAPGAAVGYAALPFFVMLLLVLAWPAAATRGFAAFAGGRARRLLVPWLCWSALYAALKLAEAALAGRPAASEFAPWMWLTGPAIHLWFLPFAFAACLAAAPLARLAGPAAGRLPFAPALAVLALAALALLGLAQTAGRPVPVAQWAFAAPAVPLGLAFALAAAAPPPHRRRRIAAAGGAGLALAAAALLLGWTAATPQYLLAAPALAACLLRPAPATRRSRAAADLALGVYLGHALVAALALRLLPVAPGSTALFLVTAAGSLALAAGLVAAAAWSRRSAAGPRPQPA